VISKTAQIGKNTIIKEGVVIEDNVTIGDNCYIDYNAVIKENVEIGSDSFIGANCILGEVLGDFFDDFQNKTHLLSIGGHAIIRSGSILYGGSTFGSHFSTGHRVTVREKSVFGSHVSLGTLSDVQGDCQIGNYVHMHSNVHIGMRTRVKDYVWIFPYVVFTNDPTPPSTVLLGSVIEEFAVICTGSVVLPGIHIGKDALVGAAANVTKDVPAHTIVVGNPAKSVGDVEKIRNADGKQVYPWRYTFSRGMPWAGTTYDEWMEADKDRKNHRNSD